MNYHPRLICLPNHSMPFSLEKPILYFLHPSTNLPKLIQILIRRLDLRPFFYQRKKCVSSALAKKSPQDIHRQIQELLLEVFLTPIVWVSHYVILCDLLCSSLIYILDHKKKILNNPLILSC
jgi:hypothetical protein